MASAGPRRADIARFREYREYEARKIDANNAMMALLAGAQLAAHLLKLTEGSDHLLPQVFPGVEHIKRFNLRTAQATEILFAADPHLGMMGVPYVLALHEDYLRTCVRLLAGEGLCRAKDARANLVELHGIMENITGYKYSADLIAYIDTLRLMRNCVIHNGGLLSQPLYDQLKSWTPAQELGWEAVAVRNPRHLRLGERLLLGHGEMLAALAFTKRLDRETNLGLQVALPRSCWAKLVVDEVASQHPSLVKDRNQALRKARGVARHHYGVLKLTDAELQSEISLR
ncbi:hypothetical protein [Nocardia bhagyanarayanae]|uniref:Abi-like protein n=1 Tax=Nocardia bhagyanarayanae TaxID=1215925 RepID=A0A543EVP4_9NOCA|nr:hypothetical protein [Nocardia bhagyanarayanae]TQM25640.1 hypothetical protein FB390_5797 [Nocardia bhagyanarayanae]